MKPEDVVCSRRSVLGAATLSPLALMSFAWPRDNSPEEANRPSSKQLSDSEPHAVHHEVEQLTAHADFFQGSGVEAVLKMANPTLVNTLVFSLSHVWGVGHMLDQNFKQYARGTLERDKLIYNNADKFAGIVFEIAVAVIPYLARLSLYDLRDNTGDGINEKRGSDVASMTAYHGKSLLYVHLYNPFQALLRKAYLDILTEREEFGMDPRNVPLGVVTEQLRKKLDEEGGPEGPVLQSRRRRSLSRVLDYLIRREIPGEVTLPYAIRRDLERCLTTRGALDLLSVGLSYPATIFGNYGLGALVGAPSRFAWYTRDMLERLEKQGQPVGHLDEEFLSSVSYFLNGSLSRLYTSAIQLGVDYGLGFHRYSHDDLAMANLRELVGTTLGWIVGYMAQSRIEPIVRKSMEAKEPPAWMDVVESYLRP